MIRENDEREENSSESRPRKTFEFFEDFLPEIGGFGKYQWILLLSLYPFGIAFAGLFFGPLFITAVPQKHWCKIDELMNLNFTVEQRIKLAIPESKQYPYYDRCHHKKLNFQNLIETKESFDSSKWNTNETVKCNKWEYDFSLIPYPSIGVEMDWVCDQEYLIPTAQSVFFIGSLFGNFIFGWISDQKGRIMALKFCTATAFIATIGTANCHTFWTFTLCRFLSGFAFNNILTIPLILAIEYTSEKKRLYITCFGFGFNSMIGLLIITWSAYFISNWRVFTYFTSFVFLFCFLLTFLMPESIRWFMSKGMSDKILKKLRRISTVNGKNPESWMYDEFLQNIACGNKNVESATILDLRKTPHLAKNTVLFSIIFAITSFIFDTHVYYLSRYEFSIFMSFTWPSIESFVACIIFQFLVNRCGRRFSGSLYLFASMIFSYAFVFLESETAKVFMGSLSRIGINCLYLLFCQYIPEFLPTTLRTQGSAPISFLALIVHFLAPYLLLLASFWKDLPILVVATIALLNSILILFLPETAGKYLRQTLREGEDFCKEQKFWPILVFQKRLIVK